MSKTTEYEFEDGFKLTGTVTQITEAATKIGRKIDFTKLGSKHIPSGYYPSESKGLVKISEMNVFHLKRALLKRAKDYFAKVYDEDDSI